MSNEIYNSKLKTQNSKLKTQNSKLKTQNSKLKILLGDRMRLVATTVGDAALVHRLTQEAFAEYFGVMPVPSSVHGETLAEVEAWLAKDGGVLAWEGNEAVGAARYKLEPEYLYVGRVAVLPAYRGKGIAVALMRYLEELAPRLGRSQVCLGTRESMPGNIAFYQKLGYQILNVTPHERGPDMVIWLGKSVG